MSNDYFFYRDADAKSDATRAGTVGPKDAGLAYSGKHLSDGIFLAVNGETVIDAGAPVVNKLVVAYRDVGRQGWHIARPDVRFAVVRGVYAGEWCIGFIHESNARARADDLNAQTAAACDVERLRCGSVSTKENGDRWAVIDLYDFTRLAGTPGHCTPRYAVKHRDAMTLGEPCAPYGSTFTIAAVNHDCYTLNAGEGLPFDEWFGRKLWDGRDHRNGVNVVYAIVDTHDDWHRRQRAGVAAGAQPPPRGITDAAVCTAWAAFQAWREACDMSPAPVETQYSDGQLTGIYIATPDLPTKVFFTVAQCRDAWTNELQRKRPPPQPPLKLMTQIDCLDDHEEAYMPDEPSRLNDMASLVRELFVVPR